MPQTGKEYILFTVDVEDWFQVENLKGAIPLSSWPECELRVERNTHLLLDLLDSIDSTAGTPEVEITDGNFVKILFHTIGQTFSVSLRQRDVPIAVVKLKRIETGIIAIPAFTYDFQNLRGNGKAGGAISRDRTAGNIFQRFFTSA